MMITIDCEKSKITVSKIFIEKFEIEMTGIIEMIRTINMEKHCPHDAIDAMLTGIAGMVKVENTPDVTEEKPQSPIVSESP